MYWNIQEWGREMTIIILKFAVPKYFEKLMRKFLFGWCKKEAFSILI
jgi:hypothetical protein